MPAHPVRIHDPRYADVVGKAPEAEVIAKGFKFTEGPVWHPKEKWLVFSDIPSDRMHRWTAKGGCTVFREPSHMANGNTLDPKGRLLTCEHATSRVSRTEANGKVVVLASHHAGKELNSPNDIVARSDGRIYFTDPTYGRQGDTGVARPLQLPFRGVYRIDPDGKLVLLVDDFVEPNGLAFTPDERQLYVNDSEAGTIRIFDVDAGGGIKGGKVWAAPGMDATGSPDGMKVDAAGNVYCCGPGGLYVYAPDATLLCVLPFDEFIANMAFGGDDYRDLFCTVSTAVYRIRVQAPGRPVFS
jgi:gluconolactonase